MSSGAHSNPASINEYLNHLLADKKASDLAYQTNICPKNYWPIPFFGNPREAKVLTIGVNPSSGEFAAGRRWTEVNTPKQWKERLRDYFKLNTIPPHKWFAPWTFGLSLLGLSYVAGTAAHADVSYRPTFAMSNEDTDSELFRAMAERDVEWLFRLLPLCPNLRLLFTYGPILSSYGRYEGLVHFVATAALRFGYDARAEDGFTALIHRDTWRTLFLHDGATRGEECVTCSVAKKLNANRERLLRSFAGG